MSLRIWDGVELLHRDKLISNFVSAAGKKYSSPDISGAICLSQIAIAAIIVLSLAGNVRLGAVLFVADKLTQSHSMSFPL